MKPSLIKPTVLSPAALYDDAKTGKARPAPIHGQMLAHMFGGTQMILQSSSLMAQSRRRTYMHERVPDVFNLVTLDPTVQVIVGLLATLKCISIAHTNPSGVCSAAGYALHLFQLLYLSCC
jgi:hypothetical protein